MKWVNVIRPAGHLIRQNSSTSFRSLVNSNLNEQGIIDSLSVNTFLHAALHARKVADLNFQLNEFFVEQARLAEPKASHPDPVNAGKPFIRSTINGKKELLPPAETDIRLAPIITVGGKDSSQTKKDCSAIGAIVERLMGADSPEALKLDLGGFPPLAYLSQSTTPTLDRYAAEGHIAYSTGQAYFHPEAEHFARTLLLPRYLDDQGKVITDSDKIPKLCGFSFSAGGKQWLAYLSALENELTKKGLPQEEARQLIGSTISLTGIGLCPDTRGLHLSPSSSLYSVSIFDCGTRPQIEEYQRLFSHNQIGERIASEGMALVTVPETDGRVQHRIAVFGQLPVIEGTKFGHHPRGYEQVITNNPALSTLYRVMLKGTSGPELHDAQGAFDSKSISYTALKPEEKDLVVDSATGYSPWQESVIGNFTTQLLREMNSRDAAKTATQSR